jgi:dihydroorotase
LTHSADGFDYNGNELDPYEQEPHFIRETLPRIIDAHPDLKISAEHLSTMQGAAFIMKHGGEKLGCSLTQQHLTKDRRDVFRGGFRTHLMWWPVIQSAEHKAALQELAVADKPFVWLGTDSAPHLVGSKEAACCLGGVLTHHIGLEGYVEAFEDMGALDDRFERFASINGPKFFGIRPSTKTLILERKEWTVSGFFPCREGVKEGESETIIPFRAGEKIRWKIID